MELYYRDLISEEASLDKLVDNLMLVVQGAEEFAEAAGARLLPGSKEEISTRLQRLKEGCLRIQKQALTTALTADKILRQYPYSSLGLAFGLGLLAGSCLHRRR